MRKYSLIFLLFLTIGNPTTALSQGINFRDITFQDALRASAKENKPVFLHGFAAWCHFCEYMKDSVYPTATVGDFFNKNFINIRLDMEKEGKDLNTKLQMASFPTLVFYDADGTVLHRTVGKKDGQDLIEIGKTALDSTKRLRTYELKYQRGKCTAEEAYIYFNLLTKAGIDNQSYINKYFDTIPDKNFVLQSYWRILYDQFRDVERPLMQRFISMEDELSKVYTKDSVENRILSSYNTCLMMKVQKLDTLGYREQIKKIKATGNPLAPKIAEYAELNRLKMASDYKNYMLLAPPFAEKYCKDDYRRLNELAQFFYERASEPAQFQQALGWAQQSVVLMDNYRDNHTMAALHYKLQHKAEAIKVGEHALEIAKARNLDPKLTVLLLEKINELP